MRNSILILFFLSAVAFTLLAIPAHAQTAAGKIDGQIVNGTKDTKGASTQNVTVRLFGIDANSASHPFSGTVQSDTSGKFSFSNLDSNPSIKYLATVRYGGVDYFSDALAFDATKLQLTLPITIYETTTVPSAIQVQQTHFIFDIQGRAFSVLQIVVVQNNTDRTFIGAQDATLALPILAGAQNIQFANQDADQTTLRGDGVLTYTLPFFPGSEQIVYNYTLPFTPPTFQFNLKMPYDSAVVRLLVADVGETIQSTQFPTQTPFQAQNGQKFLLNVASNVRAGTALNAAFTNLSATASSSTTLGTPATRPANPNEPLIAQIVLGVSVLAFATLLAYAIVRKRNASF